MAEKARHRFQTPWSIHWELAEGPLQGALTPHQKLSLIRQIVDNSNLSHQEVVFVTKSIDSLQTEIISQLKTQVEPAAPTKK